MVGDNCNVCPHLKDCVQNGACLDEVNNTFLAETRQRFSSLITPEQVTKFTGLLLKGRIRRRLHNKDERGITVVTAEKLKCHSAACLLWGADFVGRQCVVVREEVKKSQSTDSGRFFA